MQMRPGRARRWSRQLRNLSVIERASGKRRRALDRFSLVRGGLETRGMPDQVSRDRSVFDLLAFRIKLLRCIKQSRNAIRSPASVSAFCLTIRALRKGHPVKPIARSGRYVRTRLLHAPRRTKRPRPSAWITHLRGTRRHWVSITEYRPLHGPMRDKATEKRTRGHEVCLANLWTGKHVARVIGRREMEKIRTSEERWSRSYR